MEYREIGRSGLKVSALGLGTMNFGSDWHGIGEVGEKTARRLVDMAAEAGVNLIDTADVYGYGAAEKLLGKILKGRRDKFVIATKVLGHMRPGDPSSGGLSRKHIQKGLDESLARLGTDYVDLYMPHGPDPKVPLEESLEAFDRAVRAGKARVLGCSNFDAGAWRCSLSWAREHEAPRFEFDQVQFSLAAPCAGVDLAPVCRKEGTSLLAWSPLGGGLLSGKYMGGRRRPAGRRKEPRDAFPYFPEKRLAGMLRLLEKVARLEGVSMARAALGWVLAKSWVCGVIVGARTPRQLAESIKAGPVSGRSLDLLDRGAAVLTERPAASRGA
ncbi:MAG: aldo/keto reductase [Elusimicrobiota bacterium]